MAAFEQEPTQAEPSAMPAEAERAIAAELDKTGIVTPAVLAGFPEEERAGLIAAYHSKHAAGRDLSLAGTTLFRKVSLGTRTPTETPAAAQPPAPAPAPPPAPQPAAAPAPTQPPPQTRPAEPTPTARGLTQGQRVFLVLALTMIASCLLVAAVGLVNLGRGTSGSYVGLPRATQGGTSGEAPSSDGTAKSPTSQDPATPSGDSAARKSFLVKSDAVMSGISSVDSSIRSAAARLNAALEANSPSAVSSVRPTLDAIDARISRLEGAVPRDTTKRYGSLQKAQTSLLALLRTRTAAIRAIADAYDMGVRGDPLSDYGAPGHRAKAAFIREYPRTSSRLAQARAAL